MRNVLIVDDNQINREILKRILSKEYMTIEAANGQIAYNYLKESKYIYKEALSMLSQKYKVPQYLIDMAVKEVGNINNKEQERE